MQRDVVIVGGGLTGLAAAHELETQAVDYTLIEVKRRLGGSIHSVRAGDAVMDGGPFVLTPTFDPDWLVSVGLVDALVPPAPDSGRGVMFAGGTQTIIDALAQRITAPRLMRMAVSSIGRLETGDRYSLCMENGLIFDARTLIIAMPARYAERLFYSYAPDVSAQLRGYRYDSVVRVSLVYSRADLPAYVPSALPDMAVAFIQRTDGPPRVAVDHSLFQVGLRIDPTQSAPDTVVATAAALLGISAVPVAQHIAYWPEADPLSCYDDDHAARMAAIEAALPPSLALVGSDYSRVPLSHSGVTRLDDRIRQGREAARRMVAYLRDLSD